MDFDDSKSYQLRVRVTAEERDLLDRLRAERNRGETISDLVREAIALLVRPDGAKGTQELRSTVRDQVEKLAELLHREPRQVEESCIEGILDMIENKCTVPLIVMETKLHLDYRGKDEKSPFPWNMPADGKVEPSAESTPSA